MTEIERLAKAVAKVANCDQAGDGDYYIGGIVSSRAIVRAILTAMREPTPETVACATDVVVEGDVMSRLAESFKENTGRDLGPAHSIASPQAVTARWRAMIDHMLEGK